MGTTKTLTANENKLIQACLTQIQAFEINNGKIASLTLTYLTNGEVSINLIMEEVAEPTSE